MDFARARISRGTGFFISKKLIITNRHVIENRAASWFTAPRQKTASGVGAIDGKAIAVCSRIQRKRDSSLYRAERRRKAKHLVVGNPYGLKVRFERMFPPSAISGRQANQSRRDLARARSPVGNMAGRSSARHLQALRTGLNLPCRERISVWRWRAENTLIRGCGNRWKQKDFRQSSYSLGWVIFRGTISRSVDFWKAVASTRLCRACMRSHVRIARRIRSARSLKKRRASPALVGTFA